MVGLVGIRHVRLARPAATRRSSSRAGLLLQLIAYVVAFGVNPRPVAPFAGGWALPPAAAVGFATILCAAGAAIVIRAQQALGVQWSLTARLIEQHALITRGPYAFARHPVYAAMILMVLGTGLAFSTPLATAAALGLYLAGTLVRVKTEERLMQDAFGAEWTAYRRRVRALIPGVL